MVVTLLASFCLKDPAIPSEEVCLGYNLRGQVMMFRMKIVDVGVSMVMGVPQNGCFIREDPTKMDDLGVLPFMEPPCVNAVSAEKKMGRHLSMFP